MPVYNAAPYLEACLDSIISQDYKDWELIAVNDFSEDESAEILEKYVSKDERIRVFQNTDKGIIPALNLAYSKSTGVAITRLDADDIMPKKKLSLLYSLLIEKGRGHVSTAYVKYFADNKVLQGYKNYENWLNTLCDQENHYQEIYKECVIPSPCWMMYREDFDLVGAFQSELYPEDYDLCFRIYEQGLKIVSQKEVCHLWRDHQDRASRTDKNYADNRFIDLKISKFLQLDYKESSSLILWGAGKKGKLIASKLIEAKIPFSWICNNPQKIAKEIYGQTLLNADEIYFNNKQIIVAVANKEEQLIIKARLKNQEAYFFC